MWKRPIKRLAWPLLFRMADQVIVPSSGTRELMLSLGIPEERVTLTPNIVENDWWIAQSAGVDRTAVRQSWGASAEDMIVLFCAKLRPWKRPLDLLRAFAVAELPRALLVFAGEGPLRAELESAAASLGVAERVRFLGFEGFCAGTTVRHMGPGIAVQERNVPLHTVPKFRVVTGFGSAHAAIGHLKINLRLLSH